MLWWCWGLMTLGGALWLTYTLSAGKDKTVFLPGATSAGHQQIELACEACHSEPFGGIEALQEACVRCHGEELKAAKDSHPKSKFTDPRNADRVAKLDARYCVTCHVEHKPEITLAMGLTQPGDYCFKCHQDIAKDRPSHARLAFDTCASGGCHNYHDNRALYEDFLIKHQGEPETKRSYQVRPRDFSQFYQLLAKHPVKPLTAKEQDAAPTLRADPRIVHDWVMTAHAKAGVNCSHCHRLENAKTPSTGWLENPGPKVCATCHGPEVEGFLAGKHGMRLAQNLPPMTVAEASLPMQEKARHKKLDCTACHAAHGFDTQRAAVEGCLACHADEHSLAYKASPHFKLWRRQVAGQAPPGSGVSCATCHLPREPHKQEGAVRTLVQHNQNLNLRPNEKMLRSVCMNCHGLAFSIDALADSKLIERNFQGRPAAPIASIDMAKRRAKSGLDEPGPADSIAPP